ncbi:MAG: ATP-dependent helicase [Candidatus Bipolaricaulia bacterium]
MIKFQTEPHSDKEIFAVLHPLVAAWFRRQFATFSPPQRYAVLNIHRGENCLISAPTGSGKTFSFALAILSELLTLADRGALEDRIYCVYISPLKALGNDIERNLYDPLGEIRSLAQEEQKDVEIRVAVRTGDTPAHRRQQMLTRPPHILITTPESLAIALASKRFSEQFNDLNWVVIDEIHALAASKRGAHLSLSLERLQEMTDFIRIGLSATISPLEEVARFLVGRKYGRILAGAADDEDLYRDCRVVDVRFIKDLDLKVLSPVADFIRVSAEEKRARMYALLDRLIQQHRTTLIFTNTRAGTESIVHNLKIRFPDRYTNETIAAHHGSLSRRHRLDVERRLKEGELQVVACSTSLELGIDIGYIDLVVLLGSPKSVARALQRVGRSGHKLHDRITGRIMVMDQDDLVECAVLLKSALEDRIDRIQIPRNALDVLAQQIFGTLIGGKVHVDDLWELVTRSHNYEDLSEADFEAVLDYLAGEYTSLEDRNVYAKIWYDRERGMLGKRGRLARVIYMTNVGTIPDESYVTVKRGRETIGRIEESFLAMLRKNDVFVLGGNTYRFRYARGMTAQVESAIGHSPTVPSWFSEMLPLSFELALNIQQFRQEMARRFEAGRTQQEIEAFIERSLFVDQRSTHSLYRYFAEQFRHAPIPHREKILVESCREGDKRWVVFHALFGRRTNDALSRAIAWLIARRENKDVKISITDHGFYLAYQGTVRVMDAFNELCHRRLRQVLEDALEETELLKRRFRHCATRGLMILRHYQGQRRSVGRQQFKSTLLKRAVEDLDDYFPILKEAYREVLEDAMDVAAAERVLDEIRAGRIEIEGMETDRVSPFAFHIMMQGRADIIKAEDRQRFLQRMYAQLVADRRSPAAKVS